MDLTTHGNRVYDYTRTKIRDYGEKVVSRLRHPLDPLLRHFKGGLFRFSELALSQFRRRGELGIRETGKPTGFLDDDTSQIAPIEGRVVFIAFLRFVR